jgi:hypothetical protein
MPESTDNESRSRCVFCHMDTEIHYLKLPMCTICREQSYDFLWVSLVQALIVLAGGLSGFFFILEEILLFTVLVLVKHRIPPSWDRSL